MRNRVISAARVVFAAASVAGVVTQLVIAVRTDFGVLNFFSYFTTLGNLFASTVFVVGAVRTARGRPSSPRWEAVRGASVVYMAFVGIVFNTLLRDADLGDLTPWVNVVHHMLMPLAVVLDWVFVPPRWSITRRVAAWWVAVPVVYTAYSLAHGAASGFYPYPFFDPSRGGYGTVALWCVVLLVAFLVLAALVRLIGNALSTRARRSDPEGASTR
ncbi:Pr6Pr family membrane protein [Curtobacterium flaccumfaciens pv. oortii]|uniref:Pr6Pr family membrane protein n=1 Tax=Curtobacterium flaccumfaciens TaxID=2035 RepID=UPI001BDF3ABD|nr:Pr6Pr family membrane protein [Curtobacterium flaccumfaciens]MBT1621870.1 Pr6Pr family membrane protein [Curtobacterium flaccumfaciens pv. oortii]